ELLELAVELRGQRLVVRDHQRGPAPLRQHVRDGERLPRAGDAEQRLLGLAGAQAGDQLGDGLRLVAGGRVGRLETEAQGGAKVAEGAAGGRARLDAAPRGCQSRATMLSPPAPSAAEPGPARRVRGPCATWIALQLAAASLAAAPSAAAEPHHYLF